MTGQAERGNADGRVGVLSLATYCLGVFVVAHLASVFIHECGHVLSGIATGGAWDRIEFSVLGWSQAVLDPPGEARAVSWGGIQWATTISLTAFLLCWAVRSRAVLWALVFAIKTFAASGQYLMVGVLTGKGDGAHLLAMGISQTALLMVGGALLLAVLPLAGLVGPLLGVGRPRTSYWITLGGVGLPVVLMSTMVLFYNLLCRPAQWQFWGATCGGAVLMAVLSGTWVHFSAPWFDGEEALSRRCRVSPKRAAASVSVAIAGAALLAVGFPVTTSTFIDEAIRDDNKSRLESLLGDEDVNMTMASAWRGTPLHLAVTYGKTNMVEFLLAKGADVNATNAQGATAMHFVGWSDSIPIAEMLVSAGADIDRRSTFGGTPLHSAVAFRSTNIVEYLVAIGADTSLTNFQGQTAVDFARFLRREDLLPLLRRPRSP